MYHNLLILLIVDVQCTLCHIEVANLSGGNCESTGGKSYSLFGEVIRILDYITMLQQIKLSRYACSFRKRSTMTALLQHINVLL